MRPAARLSDPECRRLVAPGDQRADVQRELLGVHFRRLPSLQDRSGQIGARNAKRRMRVGIVKLAALQGLKPIAGSNYAASSAASRHAAGACA